MNLNKTKLHSLGKIPIAKTGIELAETDFADQGDQKNPPLLQDTSSIFSLIVFVGGKGREGGGRT